MIRRREAEAGGEGKRSRKQRERRSEQVCRDGARSDKQLT